MRALTTTPNPATLAAFRRLMRARAALFADDAYALDASRAKLRDEFLQNRGATDAAEIDELLAGGNVRAPRAAHASPQGLESCLRGCGDVLAVQE